MCKYDTWHWLNQDTGEVRPFSCGSWNCESHQGLVAYKWATRLARSKPERMITLTNIPKNKTHAYHAFKQLVRDIRAAGIPLEYCRFMEVGSKTGMYHFHLAQKGGYIPQAFLSGRAAANGLGKVVDIRRCQGKGPAWYLAKYVTKEGVPEGWRKVASSRRFFPKEEPVVSDGTWVLVQGELGLCVAPGPSWGTDEFVLGVPGENDDTDSGTALVIIGVGLLALLLEWYQENSGNRGLHGAVTEDYHMGKR